MKALVGKMEVKKHAIRQTQDGWVVSFVVHPSDMTPEFAAAPLGTRLMLGYAEYGDEEPAPAKPSGDRSEKAREAYAQKDKMAQAATRAAMLCKDEEFQDWLSEAHHALWHATMHAPHGRDQYAIRALRSILKVDSRAKIASDERAYESFLALELEYKSATGQFAEAR